MFVRAGACLFFSLGAFFPFLLNSEQAHIAKPPNSSDRIVNANPVQPKNAAEMIKLLQEKFERANDDQSIAVEIQGKTAKNVNEKLQRFPVAYPAPRSESGTFYSPQISKSSISIGGCDPSTEECVFVYEQTNVGDAKKIVEEAAQIDPKVLQKALEKLSNSPKFDGTKSALSPDIVKLKEQVPDALYIDKTDSADLKDIMRAVDEVKSSGATEAQAEVNTNQNLDENLQRQDRALSSGGAFSDSEIAPPDLQASNTGQYVNYARDAIQLDQNSNQPTADHTLLQDLAVPEIKNSISSSFSSIKKFDANNAEASKYVSVLKNLSEMEEFQKQLQKKLGDQALNQFNASAIAADLSDEKNISKAKLGLIADIFKESTGLNAPNASTLEANSPKGVFAQNSVGAKGNGGAFFKSSSSDSGGQVVQYGASASSEDEISWVQVAKELSSREALRLLSASNPKLAENLRQGRLELDKLISELRELYSLGFLNMIDGRNQFNVKVDYRLSLERVSLLLRVAAKALPSDQNEKGTVLNKLRIKKNADEMLKKIKTHKEIELVAEDLKSFTLENPHHKLWREFYLDEFRRLRSEAGLMQVLSRLNNIKESSLGVLVRYTFDQMKKQGDDERGKDMVDTLTDSNTRNKASVPADNPF